MAQGTLELFEEFSKTIGDGTHDLDNDSFKIALVSQAIASVPLNTATPSLDDFTEVTGGGYSAGGLALTTAWQEVGGTASFKHDGGTLTWTQNGTGPTDIRTGIIYNTATGNNAICRVDFTSDGSTAISLQDGDITWTPDASNNIFTLA